MTVVQMLNCQIQPFTRRRFPFKALQNILAYQQHALCMNTHVIRSFVYHRGEPPNKSAILFPTHAATASTGFLPVAAYTSNPTTSGRNMQHVRMYHSVMVTPLSAYPRC